MHCHEARTRMSGSGEQDAELLEHMRLCHRCRSWGEVEGKLTRSFIECSIADGGEATPFAALKQIIENRIPLASRKDTPLMSSFVNQLRTHPSLSVGLVVAVAMFLVVSLVPFSYERISGYSASITVPRSGNAELKVADIRSALSIFGYDKLGVGVEQTPEGTTYQLDKFATRDAAREAASAVRLLAGSNATMSVSPVFETVSASLYAQVRDRIVTINIDGVGKSDAQLESEIAAKLAENGLSGANVSVSTEAGGMRKISINRDSQSANDSLRLQINMQDSGGCGPVNLHLIQDSTMTDAELKAAIEAKLSAEGTPDANVSITRTPVGKRRVEVEVRKN